MEIIRKWVDSLTHEQCREELLKLHAKYDERGVAMRDTGDMVRSLFVCARCGGKRRDIGEKVCHCAKGNNW